MKQCPQTLPTPPRPPDVQLFRWGDGGCELSANWPGCGFVQLAEPGHAIQEDLVLVVGPYGQRAPRSIHELHDPTVVVIPRLVSRCLLLVLLFLVEPSHCLRERFPVDGSQAVDGVHDGFHRIFSRRLPRVRQ